MTWTKRTSLLYSPVINDENVVINTISDTISRYKNEPTWNKRTGQTTEYTENYGLWIKNYYPWKDDSFPWRREMLSTNWTNRTPL